MGGVGTVGVVGGLHPKWTDHAFMLCVHRPRSGGTECAALASTIPCLQQGASLDVLLYEDTTCMD